MEVVRFFGMASLVLPKLPAGFTQLGGCIIIEPGDEQFAEWVKQNSLDDSVAKYTDASGEDRWIQVELGILESKSIHLHIEISRKEKELEHGGGPRHSFEHLAKLVEEFVDKSGGGEKLMMTRARMPVPRADIPESSTIGKLLGFSSESCGARFSMKGGSLDIEDEAFTRMTFNYQEKKQTVFVELWAFVEVEFDGNYLCCLSEFMATGAECYVLERISREATSHA